MLELQRRVLGTEEGTWLHEYDLHQTLVTAIILAPPVRHPETSRGILRQLEHVGISICLYSSVSIFVSTAQVLLNLESYAPRHHQMAGNSSNQSLNQSWEFFGLV